MELAEENSVLLAGHTMEDLFRDEFPDLYPRQDAPGNEAEDEEGDGEAEEGAQAEKYREAMVAADDTEAYISERDRAAREDEHRMNQQRDQAFTRMWRITGLPEKFTPLELDSGYMRSQAMINSKGLLQRFLMERERELQPPITYTFMDRNAPKGYQTTRAGSQKNMSQRSLLGAQPAGLETVHGTTEAQEAHVAAILAAADKAMPPPVTTGLEQLQDGGRTKREAKRTAKGEGKQTLPTVPEASGTTSSPRKKPRPTYLPEQRPRWKDLPREQVEELVKLSEARRASILRRMPPEQYEREMRLLRRMNHSLQFLRNPRHLPAASYKEVAQRARAKGEMGMSLRHKLTADTERTFNVEPAEVLFRVFEPGSVFKTMVELRNVSGVSRRLRILPPTSQYFTLDAISVPHEGGLVAPGMSASCVVVFTPDSVAQYDDVLAVETDAGRIEIPLLGRRDPPKLGIPKDIDVGPCLMDNTKTIAVQFTNTGGGARFCLVDPEPSTRSQRLMSPRGTGRRRNFRHSVDPTGGEIDPRVAGSGLNRQVSSFVMHDSTNLHAPDFIPPLFGTGGTAEPTAGEVGDIEDVVKFTGASEGAENRTSAASEASDGTIGPETAGARLEVSEFSIWPSRFEVTEGAQGWLQVTFRPRAPGRCRRRIQMVCDNGTVRTVNLLGESCALKVQIEGIDGRAPSKEEFVMRTTESMRSGDVLSQLPSANSDAPGAYIAMPSRGHEAAVPAWLLDLWFGEVIPGSSVHRVIQIYNPLPLKLPYQWAITPRRPRILLSDGTGWTRSTVTGSRPPGRRSRRETAHAATGFAVFPDAGILEPHTLTEFKITFGPIEVGESRALLTMLVDRSVEGTTAQQDDEDLYQPDPIMVRSKSTRSVHAARSVRNLPPPVGGDDPRAVGQALSRRRTAALGHGYAKFKSTARRSQSTKRLGDADARPVLTSAPTMFHNSDLDAATTPLASFSLAGLGRPVSVLVEPPYLQVPGSLTPGQRWESEITVANPGPAPAEFTLSQPLPEGLTVDPPVGTIEPFSELALALDLVAPQRCGLHAGTLEVIVRHGGVGAALPVRYVVTGPDVALSTPKLDLKLVQMNCEATESVTLTNTSPCTPAAWSLAVGRVLFRRGGAPEGQWEVRDPSDCEKLVALTLSEQGGVMEPLGAAEIALAVRPFAEGTIKLVLEVSVEGSATQHLPVLIDCVEPRVRVVSPEVDLGTVFEGIPVPSFVQLQNVTPFPAHVRVDETLHGGNDRMRVMVPGGGRLTIAGHAKERVRVVFHPRQLGRCQGVLALHTEGSTHLAGFRVTAVVEGLKVSYEMRTLSADPYIGPEKAVVAQAPAPTLTRAHVHGLLAAPGGPGELARSGTKPLRLPRALRANSPPPPAANAAQSRHATRPTTAKSAAGNNALGRQVPAIPGPPRAQLAPGVTFEVVGREPGALIDLGGWSPIGKPRHFQLLVHNESGIQTRARVWLKNFGVKADGASARQTPVEMATDASMGRRAMEKLRGMVRKAAGNTTGVWGSILRRAKTAAGPGKREPGPRLAAIERAGGFGSELGQEMELARQVEETSERSLTGGKGIAVTIAQEEITIEGHSTGVFDLTVHSDMCGTYFDVLHCQAGMLPPQAFPFKIGVVGSPLFLHNTRRVVQGYQGGRATEIAVDFGEVPLRLNETRPVFVTNTSPFPLKLSWEHRNIVVPPPEPPAPPPRPRIPSPTPEPSEAPSQPEDGAGSQAGSAKGDGSAAGGTTPPPEDGDAAAEQPADADAPDKPGDGAESGKDGGSGAGSDAGSGAGSAEAGEVEPVDDGKPVVAVGLTTEQGRLRLLVDPAHEPADPSVIDSEGEFVFPFRVEPPVAAIGGGETARFDVTYTALPGRGPQGSWACEALLVGHQELIKSDAAAAQVERQATHTRRQGGGEPGRSFSPTFTEGGQTEGGLGGATAVARRQQRRRGTQEHISLSLVPGNGSENARLNALLQGSYHPTAAPPDLSMGVLRVKLAAKTTPSRLEPDVEGALKFLVFASEPSSHSTYRAAVTLTNTQHAAVAFRLSVTGPWLLQSIVPSIPREMALTATHAASDLRASLRRDGDHEWLLPPRENVEVLLQLEIPEDRVNDADDYCLDGTLHAGFTNGDAQELPLMATVVHPELEVNMAEISYGQVHVEAPKPIKVVLTNPTLADAEWCICEKGGRPHFGRGVVPSATFGTVRVEPGTGVIPGRGLRMPNTQTITIWLAPKTVGPQVKDLWFAVRRGRGARVVVRGEGTFDETCEHNAILMDL
ncbi:unnamed protein product [Pedinophyceae sp. YPF-701]|nr:unnamed protein product [Pedinophyceae sp. YPF-701]